MRLHPNILSHHVLSLFEIMCFVQQNIRILFRQIEYNSELMKRMKINQGGLFISQCFNLYIAKTPRLTKKSCF